MNYPPGRTNSLSSSSKPVKFVQANYLPVLLYGSQKVIYWPGPKELQAAKRTYYLLRKVEVFNLVVSFLRRFSNKNLWILKI